MRRGDLRSPDEWNDKTENLISASSRALVLWHNLMSGFLLLLLSSSSPPLCFHSSQGQGSHSIVALPSQQSCTLLAYLTFPLSVPLSVFKSLLQFSLSFSSFPLWQKRKKKQLCAESNLSADWSVSSSPSCNKWSLSGVHAWGHLRATACHWLWLFTLIPFSSSINRPRESEWLWYWSLKKRLTKGSWTILISRLQGWPLYS